MLSDFSQTDRTAAVVLVWNACRVLFRPAAPRVLRISHVCTTANPNTETDCEPKGFTRSVDAGAVASNLPSR